MGFYDKIAKFLTAPHYYLTSKPFSNEKMFTFCTRVIMNHNYWYEGFGFIPFNSIECWNNCVILAETLLWGGLHTSIIYAGRKQKTVFLELALANETNCLKYEYTQDLRQSCLEFSSSL